MGPLLIDTNVIVASMVAGHAQHIPSLACIRILLKEKTKSLMSCHSLAECFSSLTSMPLENPVTPSQAREIIEENVLNLFEVVELSAQDYREAIRRVAGLNLKSGLIFDALIFQAALKKKASCVVTWNSKDFARISQGELPIVTPDSIDSIL